MGFLVFWVGMAIGAAAIPAGLAFGVWTGWAAYRGHLEGWFVGLIIGYVVSFGMISMLFDFGAWLRRFAFNI